MDRVHDNQELRALYEADQEDRSGELLPADWPVIAKRDEERRRRVHEILERCDVSTAADYYHAAMIFHHGHTPQDFYRAHQLALSALELEKNNRSMKWLCASSMDRYLLRTGAPQRYGTQYGTENGRFVLRPVDPTTTDKEREQWGVRPLAQAQAYARMRNEQKNSDTE